MAENARTAALPQPFVPNRDAIWKELREKGYTTLPGLLSEAECDEYISQYKQWLEQFGPDEWPSNARSIIQDYKIGHFRPSWCARLKAKKVFSCLWGTEKLLTSVDGVAIAEPAETGVGGFAKHDQNWFHLDQSGQRTGLHCVQGAVYLEEATETDYCFRVIEGTHTLHKQFFARFSNKLKRGKHSDFLRLNEKECKWYQDQGCKVVKVPCPKGGMLLWDSRLVHDNAQPEFKRPHTDRWRFVVFVCMAPAQWANQEDIGKKHKCYKEMLMTSHWPGQGMKIFAEHLPRIPGVGPARTIQTLPDNATTDEVKRMMGVEEYDLRTANRMARSGSRSGCRARRINLIVIDYIHFISLPTDNPFSSE
ncbi:hypothetical protein ScPMuIL_012016 [Solemya velum]